MTNRLLLLLLSAVVSNCLGQLPEFDVLALHRVPRSEDIPGIGKEGGPGTRKPNQFSCRYCTISMFIGMAFDLKPYQIVGPSAIEEEHYMLNAQLPPGTSPEQFRKMIQRMLKDRFGLTFHMADKKMTAFLLRVARGGAKVTGAKAVSDGDETGKLGQRSGRPEFKMDKDGLPILPDVPGLVVISMKGNTRMRSTNETMQGFASFLSDQIEGPVVDETELKDRYDFNLTWANDTLTAAKGPTEVSIYPDLHGALTSQLGLKLDRGSRKIPVLVVEHLERTPTAN